MRSRGRDRLRPILFDLVDGQQRALRAERVFAGLERAERFLRAIQQARLQEILAEFEQRVIALGDRQVGATQEILMHADRAVGLAAPAKQVAERKVQFDGFGIELRDFDEGVDRLVVLLVEQEVQAAEVRARQIRVFGQQRFQVIAGRHPAQRKRDGNDEQPPEV